VCLSDVRTLGFERPRKTVKVDFGKKEVTFFQHQCNGNAFTTVLAASLVKRKGMRDCASDVAESQCIMY
jgi:hypothetical protein